MTTRSWILLFIVALLANGVATQAGVPYLDWCTKSLIVPALVGYYASATKATPHPLKKWVFLALLFSWSGDVLLMFQPRGELFFIFGLLSFLVAHIFYCIHFYYIRKQEQLKPRWAMAIPVAGYYAVLVAILFPYLGALQVPVIVYGAVISTMLLFALHLLLLRNKNAGQWMATGAILFVASDSLLAINKFYEHFRFAGMAIMLLYGFAQYFIIKGSAQWMTRGFASS